MQTGSKDLDFFIDEYKKEITYIYGEYATGKTTLCIQSAAHAASKDKKVVFIDTEAGFSLDRLRQIAGFNYISILDKILLLKVKDFDDQCKKIEMIRNLVNIDIIIIDTIGAHYRRVLKDSPTEINRKMDRQLKIIKKLSKETPVLMTNQVYMNIDNQKITPVGGEMIKKYCKKILFINKQPREIIFKNKKFPFTIQERGITKI